MLFDALLFPVNTNMLVEGLESTEIMLNKIKQQQKFVKFDRINCKEKHGSRMTKYIFNQ